jgi:hypothetical protein
VDWNIVKSPCYTSLFDLTHCYVPCQIYLSLEFNREHYNTVSEAAPIFQTIQKLVMNLHSRGCVVKCLTLCPSPKEYLGPYLANFFPITYLALNPKLTSVSHKGDLTNNTKQVGVSSDTSQKLEIMLTLGLDASFFENLQIVSTADVTPVTSFKSPSVQLFLNEHSFPFTQHIDGPYEKFVSLLVALNKYQADCRSKGICQYNNVCDFLRTAKSSKCIFSKLLLKRIVIENFSQSNQQYFWIPCSECSHSLQIFPCGTTEAFMQAFDLLSAFLPSIITNVQFETFWCDVNFDSFPYDSANGENHCFQSWLNDVLLVPFLSLLKLNIPLRKYILILRGISSKYTCQFTKTFNTTEQGITIDWLPKKSTEQEWCDALIFLRHPEHWSLAMSQWLLKDFLSNESSPFFVISNKILFSKKRKRLNTW